MDEGEILHVASTEVGIDASERRRRRAIFGVAASAVLLVGVSVLMVTTDTSACGVCYVPCLTGLISAAGLVGAQRRPELVPGTVTLAAGTLSVAPAAGGPREVRGTFPLAHVVQGFWEGPHRVRLVMRSGQAVVVRASREDGDRLLRAAGVSAAERVLRVPLVSAAARVPGGTVLAGMALGSLFIVVLGMVTLFAKELGDTLFRAAVRHEHGEVAFFAGVFVVSAALLGALLRRREAVVGTDGVLFRGALWNRFVPYAALASAGPCARGVRLSRKAGAPVVLPTGAVFTPAGELYREAILQRIREALAAGGGAAMAAVDLERLERRGRPVEVWREELGKVLLEAGDYRRRSISAADLASVIEDPSAPAERRIGAAVALGAAQRDEARRRVRIATQACADDALRIALERAAEGEIEAALVEREEKRRSGR